jgi:hypothetical protein
MSVIGTKIDGPIYGLPYFPDGVPKEERMPGRPEERMPGRRRGKDQYGPGDPMPDYEPGLPRPKDPGRPGFPGQKPPAMDEVDTFLSNAYLRNLDRQIDDEGKKYWGDEIRSGRATKEDVIGNLRRSEEYGGVVENFLTDAYRNNLGRDADTEGFDYWANELKSGKMDRDQVYSAIKGSKEAEEYRKTRPPEDDMVRPMPDGGLPPVGGEKKPKFDIEKPRMESPTGITAVKAAIDRDNEGRSDEEKEGQMRSAALIGRLLAGRG